MGLILFQLRERLFTACHRYYRISKNLEHLAGHGPQYSLIFDNQNLLAISPNLFQSITNIFFPALAIDSPKKKFHTQKNLLRCPQYMDHTYRERRAVLRFTLSPFFKPSFSRRWAR